MLLFASTSLLAGAAIGHVVFWVAAVNRTHALGLPRWTIGLLAGFCWAALACIPFALIYSYPLALFGHVSTDQLPLWTYAAFCHLVVLWAVAERVHRGMGRRQRTSVLISNHTSSLDLVEAIGHRPVEGRLARFVSQLPLNQVMELRIHEKNVRLPRLPASLDGLRIAHLSDLHMFGGIQKSFYEQVVEQTNDLKPDLVALTGDLFDRDRCIDWIDDTLARLEARYGVYFILGNHDLRVNSDRVRQRLAEAGLVDVGGRWLRLRVRGESMVLAGNELPWFGPSADLRDCPRQESNRHVPRVLLSHSPDQITWACHHDFDLMLAGHTHGGQVRFPLLGPVFCPSAAGTRYNAGTFYVEPTVLHVTRGISGMTPLRVNCAPELALLVLASGSKPETV